MARWSASECKTRFHSHARATPAVFPSPVGISMHFDVQWSSASRDCHLYGRFPVAVSKNPGNVMPAVQKLEISSSEGHESGGSTKRWHTQWNTGRRLNKRSFSASCANAYHTQKDNRSPTQKSFSVSCLTLRNLVTALLRAVGTQARGSGRACADGLRRLESQHQENRDQP